MFMTGRALLNLMWGGGGGEGYPTMDYIVASHLGGVEIFLVTLET